MTAALIGRAHPAAVLRAQLDRAAESHGGLVLVTGEAGIGKTTLVTRAAEEARRELGALVLSGSCWDSDSAPGYWPWVQVIRALRRGISAAEWATAEEAAGGTLSVLLGESAQRTTPAAEGFPLYDAVTTALVTASQARPVVVVLDDLHWADRASLQLLEFAAQHTWFERLLLVGTYRDAEVEAADHPLQPLMMGLVAKATTVSLTGLDVDEVAALIARTTGREPDPELVDEVHRRTGGNPFFVEQTARLWHSGGSVSAVAPGVREAVRRRLSLLPEPVAQLLGAASVLGREFHRQLLAATAPAPVAQVDRLLDQAVTARLVVVLGAGRFAFAHDLVRETLYDALDTVDAARRHAAVVRALDRSPALAEQLVPADLARHAYLAGDALDPARAVDHLVAAAKDAGSRMAAEEAIGHYRRALERARAAGDTHRRALIALDLGSCLQHQSEDPAEAFAEALAVARESGDPDLLARVALALHRHEGPDLLLEAYRTVVRDRPAPESADGLAHELVSHVTTAARRSADDEALAFSLWARHDAVYGLGSAAERAELTDELMRVGRRLGDRGMEYFAASFRWVALLEQGDPGYLDQYHAVVALAEREGRPRSSFVTSIDGSIIAALHGRFAEAETLLDQAVTRFGAHDHVNFSGMALHLRWALLMQQGRYAELPEVHRALQDTEHSSPSLLEAVAAASQGSVPLVQESYPRELAPLALRLKAQVAAASRDTVRCAEARAALAPYAGEWAVSLYGCDISGPFDLWLGLLDAAEARWDDAVDRLTAAHRSADRLQARPWSIEARYHLASALVARGSIQDGRALLAEVSREAAEIGMRHRVSTVEDSPANEFHWDGSVWTVGFGGSTVHLPDAKGLRDLHTLLSHPGVDIPAVELLDPAGGAVVVAARRMSGDPILDDEAKAQYKRRLDQLDEQIDRAVERGDDDRAAAADAERQALLSELRAAAGLAGRTRRLGDEAERARKAVTARIRDTLRRLDQVHPSLAGYLRSTVTTGLHCRYQPTSGASHFRL